MKKSVIKNISLPIAGLLGLGVITFGAASFSEHKKDNINVALADEGTELPSSGGALSSGTYYINTNTTLTNYITVGTGKNIVINLNGCTLSANPNSTQPIVYVSGGTLTVNGDNGKLTGGTGYSSNYKRGGAFHLASGNVTVNSCNFENNTAEYGGAIYLGGGTITLNDCKLYNNTATSQWEDYGAIFAEGANSNASVIVNGGEIYSNDSGIMLAGWKDSTSSAQLNGVNIHNNPKYGVDVRGDNAGRAAVSVSGNTIIESNTLGNLRLQGNSASTQPKFSVTSELGDNASIGVSMTHKGVFTKSTDTSLNDASKFFSDDSGYAVGKNDDGQLFLDSPKTVTYSTEHGTAPDPVKVATGSTIPSEPISPTAEGYDFVGWYKESTFENAWDFATDVVNSDITLYAKWLTLPTASITKGTDVTYYDSFGEALSHWEVDSILTLHKDVTTSTTITINNNVILDLNGYGIRMTNTNTRLFYINSGKTLTVNDSNSTHAHAVTLSGWRGTAVTDGTGTSSVNNGSGTAYITGGYITGGYSTSSSVKEGLAFYINGGTLVLNGGNIIGNYVNVTNNSGAGVYMTGGAHLSMYDGAALIYNYAQNSAAAIEAYNSYVEIYGGTIAHNRNDWGDGAAISVAGATSIKLYGGVIEDNSTKNSGAISFVRYSLTADQYFGIKGSPTVTNNYSWNNNNNPANINLYTKAHIEGALTNTEKIGINLHSKGAGNIWNNGAGCFTIGWSTYMEGKDPRDYFFSDKSDYIIGLNAEGEVVLDSPKTVTYSTEHGTAPDSATVASGSIILDEPTEPTEGDYVFGGWYKESTFENAWDFTTDVVTSDITLYAKWYDPATLNVIKLINDIGEITYDGGVDDSQKDIIAAKTAYDALTPGQQADVGGTNKDILDHDIVTYNHVDNAGDLIKAIPDASDSQEYYDAVDAAEAAYKALTDEEEAILNADPNFDYLKALNDNVTAKEVIELIKDIGEVTYKGGQDDSKDDINNALNAYNNLTDDQKAIVDNVNKDDLDDAKETYDDVDDAIKLIESIGDVSHGGSSDSQEAIEAAREAYDSLSEEQKALVDSYNDSGKTLQDDEAVYEAMEAIDAIGDVGYDSDSEEVVAHAREVYDSLTDDQKAQLGEAYVKILTDAESKYSSLGQKGDILFIILIIVASLALIGGLVFLFFLIRKKKNKDDDDQNNGNLKKGQPAKAYSFGGLLPLVVLVSHYLDTKYIILYVIAGLAVLVWISCLVLVLAKKKAKTAIQVKDDVKVEENALPQNEDEEEVVTVTDEKGNIFQIRFIKSFTAKLIQSPIETKKYYEELKNEVLSYKKTNTRVSWHYDAINSGRNYVLKFAVRGKTLCVYFPLNADDYADSKYKVEKSESKRYEDVPCLYRIKNDRRLGYAKELIAVVANKLGLEKGGEQHEVYSNLPCEPNKPLIARGLIKELKIQVNKPIEQVLETKVNSEGDEIVVSKDEKGNIFEIRFVKSFTAKLIQSPEETKKYYEELKNYVLSYKKTTSRVSWHYDSINSGRNQVLKFAVRGKTLCVYYPLNADSYSESKYKVEKVESKKFEDVPCLYRIKNDRRLGYAKELIDVVCESLGLVRGEEQHESYANLPYEPNKPLIARGLIKELKVQVNRPSEPEVLESKTNAEGDEIVVTKDASGNIFEIRYIKSFTAKLSQSSDEVKDYYTELKNYALSYKKVNSRVSWHYDSVNVGRNQVLKFSIRGKTLCLYYALDVERYADSKYKVEKVESKKFEDVPCLYRIKNDRRRDYAKELIDVVMEKVGAVKGEEPNEDYRIPYEKTNVLLGKGLIKEVKTKVNNPEPKPVEVHESITVAEADIRMSDEKAESLIEESNETSSRGGKKEIINIDTLSEHYQDGDEVTLDSLIKKKLVSNKAGYIKVLARGTLDKKLTVVLNDFSLQAVKMIVLVGGKVKKVR